MIFETVQRASPVVNKSKPMNSVKGSSQTFKDTIRFVINFLNSIYKEILNKDMFSLFIQHIVSYKIMTFNFKQTLLFLVKTICIACYNLLLYMKHYKKFATI